MLGSYVLSRPVKNVFAESLNGRPWDECLNTNWFMSVRHARESVETWRRDYTEGLTPQTR